MSSEKQDNVPDRQEKLKQQMFLLEDKENEWSVSLLQWYVTLKETSGTNTGLYLYKSANDQFLIILCESCEDQVPLWLVI